MEVLNLATKEKQDEILSNFPIRGGTDFNNGVFSTTDIQSSHKSYKILNIDGKGIVTSISNATSGVRNYTIQVDGGDIFGLDVGNNMSVSVFIPFNTSIVIKASNDAGQIVGYILF